MDLRSAVSCGGHRSQRASSESSAYEVDESLWMVKDMWSSPMFNTRLPAESGAGTLFDSSEKSCNERRGSAPVRSQLDVDLMDATIPNKITDYFQGIFSRKSFKGDLKRTKSVTKLDQRKRSSSESDGIQSKMRTSRSHESLLNTSNIILSHDLMTDDIQIKRLHSSILGQDHCFQVSSSSGSKYYSCKSAEERENWIQSLRKAANPSRDRGKRTDNSLQIWILEAKGVQSKKKYFCELCLDKTLYARTSSKQKGEMCFWGENFDFSNLPSVGIVSVNLYKEADKKKKKEKNSLVGIVDIPIEAVCSRQFTEKWYPVLPPAQNKAGKNTETMAIRLKLRYQSVNILPLEYYREFINYISAEYKYLCEILEPVISVKAKEDVATKMVHILQKLGKVDDFLCDIVMADVERLENENLTFRGNSLATKAMEAYMKLVGEKYLQDTLSEFVKTVFESQDDCEVDPAKVPNNTCLQKHQANLTMYCEMVWCKIINSSCYFPSELKSVFHAVRERLEGSKRDEIADNLVSSCIFLRFLCPAILSPSLFGLTQEFPQDKAARNLTMIAKTIQTLANFNKFGSKEEFMKFMNEFVEREWTSMKTFLRQISSAPDDNQVQEYDGYIDLGKELSILHTVLTESLQKVKGNVPSNLAKLQEILQNITEEKAHPRGGSQRAPAVHHTKAYTDASLSSTSDLTMVSAPCKTSTLRRAGLVSVLDKPSIDLNSSGDEYGTLESNRSTRSSKSDRTEELRKRLLNGVGNGDYMDIISIMDEMRADEHGISVDNLDTNIQGSQISISQLSNVASSGYQSFAYSQSSSPVESAVHRETLDSIASSPPVVKAQRRPQPLSFANPLYHCPLSPVKRTNSGVSESSPRSRSSSCSSVSANVSDRDHDNDDDETVLRRNPAAHPLQDLSQLSCSSEDEENADSHIPTLHYSKTLSDEVFASEDFKMLNVSNISNSEENEPRCRAPLKAYRRNGSDSVLVENRAYMTLDSIYRPQPKPRQSLGSQGDNVVYSTMDKEHLVEQVTALQSQLKQLEVQLQEAEARMHIQEQRKDEDTAEWKARLAESEEKLKRQQEEKDLQMKNIITRLIGVEEELRKEQREMQNVVMAKQKIIDAQERRIQSLDGANTRLLAALAQLKERYHLQVQQNGSAKVRMDSAEFRSSAC